MAKEKIKFKGLINNWGSNKSDIFKLKINSSIDDLHNVIKVLATAHRDVNITVIDGKDKLKLGTYSYDGLNFDKSVDSSLMFKGLTQNAKVESYAKIDSSTEYKFILTYEVEEGEEEEAYEN